MNTALSILSFGNGLRKLAWLLWNEFLPKLQNGWLFLFHIWQGCTSNRGLYRPRGVPLWVKPKWGLNSVEKTSYHFLITFRSNFWRDTCVVSWYRLLDFPIHSTTFIVMYFTSLQLIQCRLNVQEPKLSWKLSVLIYFVRFPMFLSSFARKVRTTGNAGQIEKINLVLNSQTYFYLIIIVIIVF